MMLFLLECSFPTALVDLTQGRGRLFSQRTFRLDSSGTRGTTATPSITIVRSAAAAIVLIRFKPFSPTKSQHFGPQMGKIQHIGLLQSLSHQYYRTYRLPIRRSKYIMPRGIPRSFGVLEENPTGIQRRLGDTVPRFGRLDRLGGQQRPPLQQVPAPRYQ